MSFWTGFTTGLASSVDRGLQKAVEKRDGELSRAKEFWMQRKATKLEKAEEEKAAYDKKAEKAYNRLADELGDTTMAYAAFQKLGGADEALDYLSKVDEARGKLQAGQTYNIADDFVDYKAGKTTLTRAEGLQSVRMQLPSLGTVSASDLAIDDKLGRLFGREGRAAETAAESINKRFAEFQGSGAAAPTDVGMIGRVDFSRQVAAQEAKKEDIRFEREGQEFNMKVSAFKQNENRVNQQMKIADAIEARAKKQALTDEEQRQLDNARNKVADLQRVQQLEREAENHILSKRAAEQNITLNELKIQKEKSPPEFKDFEEMFVYAEQKLAQGGLTPQQRSDFETLKQSAIDGTQAWKQANPEADDSQFSPQSVNAVFDAQLKRTMGKAGLYNSLEDKVAEITQGNAESYFDNFSQVIAAVEQTYGRTDATMSAALDAQEDILAQDIRQFIDKQLAIPAQKQKRLKIFNGTPAELEAEAYTNQAYKKGDIIQYKEGDVTSYAIWTGRDLYAGDY